MTSFGQVWTKSDDNEHLFYTSDKGLDYDLTTIDADVERITQKIDGAIAKFELHHQFIKGGVPSRDLNCGKWPEHG